MSIPVISPLFIFAVCSPDKYVLYPSFVIFTYTGYSPALVSDGQVATHVFPSLEYSIVTSSVAAETLTKFCGSPL